MAAVEKLSIFVSYLSLCFCECNQSYSVFLLRISFAHLSICFACVCLCVCVRVQRAVNELLWRADKVIKLPHSFFLPVHALLDLLSASTH